MSFCALPDDRIHDGRMRLDSRLDEPQHFSKFFRCFLQETGPSLLLVLQACTLRAPFFSLTATMALILVLAPRCKATLPWIRYWAADISTFDKNTSVVCLCVLLLFRRAFAYFNRGFACLSLLPLLGSRAWSLTLHALLYALNGLSEAFACLYAHLSWCCAF